MAQINVSKEESQLVAVYRAIKELGSESVGIEDTGLVLSALRDVVDLEELEGSHSVAQMKALFYGFVAGIAATRPLPQQQGLYFEPDEDTHFSGGPSGGVAEGQGADPRYVAQTGPREDQEVE